MTNLCTDPSCYAYGRYCRLHSGKGKKEEKEQKDENNEPAKSTPAVAKSIAPFSKKREKLQRQYRKQVKDALEEDNRCEVKSPVCIGIANGFQHIVKRSAKNLMEKKNLKRCCSACQTWIEEHPLEAIEMGVSKSKFSQSA